MKKDKELKPAPIETWTELVVMIGRGIVLVGMLVFSIMMAVFVIAPGVASLLAQLPQPVEETSMPIATCQDISLEGSGWRGDISRCEMPDGMVCYLFGSHGSISCLPE